MTTINYYRVPQRLFPIRKSKIPAGGYKNDNTETLDKLNIHYGEHLVGNSIC